jgi:hypothetical protein
MRTVCEQTVSNRPTGRPRAPDGYTSNTPIFKLCFRSSEPFAASLTWALPAQPTAADRRHAPVLLSLLLSASLVGPVTPGLIATDRVECGQITLDRHLHPS